VAVVADKEQVEEEEEEEEEARRFRLDWEAKERERKVVSCLSVLHTFPHMHQQFVTQV
jgi:hypothetical protein